MIKRFLLLLILSLSLIFSTTVDAQEQVSPFGNLSSEAAPEQAERLVLSPEGQTKATYFEMLTSYKNIVDLYGKAYGQRKIQLGNQMLARSKDVLMSKLGATKVYLNDLKIDAKQSTYMSEVGEFQADTVIKLYDEFLAKNSPLVDQKGSIEEMITLGNEMNKELTKFTFSVRPQVALISINYGQWLIGLIESRAPVLQAHINGSADLGGDVSDIQEKFDNAMLDLEKAKDGYKRLLPIADGGSPADTRTYSNLHNLNIEANKNLRFAYDGLYSVLSDLRKLYSQSPWAIDKSQFDFSEEGSKGGL